MQSLPSNLVTFRIFAAGLYLAAKCFSVQIVFLPIQTLDLATSLHIQLLRDERTSVRNRRPYPP